MTARLRAAAVTHGDIDRVREWANVHLRELLQSYAPDAAAKLRGDRCPCPMHGGDGPNLSLFKNPSGPGELWRCHSGCGTSGGGVELVQALTGRPGKAGALEVLRDLAPRAGVSLEAGGLSQLGTRPPARRESLAKSLPESLGKSLGESHVTGAESRGGSRGAPDALAELRAEGVIPASPAAVHTAVGRHLSLGEGGRAYLTGRGLDPDAARAYGFRSLETPADWAGLEAFLAASYTPEERTAAGVATIPGAGKPALVLPYRSADGAGWDGFRLRSLEGKEYRSLKGFTLPLPFNAPALQGAEEVHLVEGEMNAYTLHTYGLAAVGLDGAGKWRSEWTPLLRPVARLVAWYDGDKAGTEGRRKLAEALAAAFGYEWLAQRGRFLAIPKRDGCKDANDLHQRGELAPLLERAEWRTK